MKGLLMKIGAVSLICSGVIDNMGTLVYIVGCIALGVLFGQVLGGILFHLENRKFDKLHAEVEHESFLHKKGN